MGKIKKKSKVDEDIVKKIEVQIGETWIREKGGGGRKERKRKKKRQK